MIGCLSYQPQFPRTRAHIHPCTQHSVSPSLLLRQEPEKACLQCLPRLRYVSPHPLTPPPADGWSLFPRRHSSLAIHPSPKYIYSSICTNQSSFSSSTSLLSALNNQSGAPKPLPRPEVRSTFSALQKHRLATPPKIPAVLKAKNVQVWIGRRKEGEKRGKGCKAYGRVAGTRCQPLERLAGRAQEW